MKKKKILILGGTGMLGHNLFVHLSRLKRWDVYATARNYPTSGPFADSDTQKKVRPLVDANNFDTIIRALASIKPDIVINCIGLVKQQVPWASDPLTAITVNSQLPHRISLICATVGARLIHISTDCVFDGLKGNYTEDDPSDAKDLYGRTKFLGEVKYPHCTTIRTSIIGHELKAYHGLVEWFFQQKGPIQGYTNAFFSGFPTAELAHVVSEYIIPNNTLQGIYHVSSHKISKYDLLSLIADQYGKKIEIEPYDKISIDRSLIGSRFKTETGYKPPSWPEMIEKMYTEYIQVPYYRSENDAVNQL